MDSNSLASGSQLQGSANQDAGDKLKKINEEYYNKPGNSRPPRYDPVLGRFINPQPEPWFYGKEFTQPVSVQTNKSVGSSVSYVQHQSAEQVAAAQQQQEQARYVTPAPWLTKDIYGQGVSIAPELVDPYVRKQQKLAAQEIASNAQFTIKGVTGQPMFAGEKAYPNPSNFFGISIPSAEQRVGQVESVGRQVQGYTGVLLQDVAPVRAVVLGAEDIGVLGASFVVAPKQTTTSFVSSVINPSTYVRMSEQFVADPLRFGGQMLAFEAALKPLPKVSIKPVKGYWEGPVGSAFKNIRTLPEYVFQKETGTIFAGKGGILKDTGDSFTWYKPGYQFDYQYRGQKQPDIFGYGTKYESKEIVLGRGIFSESGELINIEKQRTGIFRGETTVDNPLVLNEKQNAFTDFMSRRYGQQTTLPVFGKASLVGIDVRTGEYALFPKQNIFMRAGEPVVVIGGKERWLSEFKGLRETTSGSVESFLKTPASFQYGAGKQGPVQQLGVFDVGQSNVGMGLQLGVQEKYFAFGDLLEGVNKNVVSQRLVQKEVFEPVKGQQTLSMIKSKSVLKNNILGSMNFDFGGVRYGLASDVITGPEYGQGQGDRLKDLTSGGIRDKVYFGNMNVQEPRTGLLGDMKFGSLPKFNQLPDVTQKPRQDQTPKLGVFPIVSMGSVQMPKIDVKLSQLQVSTQQGKQDNIFEQRYEGSKYKNDFVIYEPVREGKKGKDRSLFKVFGRRRKKWFELGSGELEQVKVKGVSFAVGGLGRSFKVTDEFGKTVDVGNIDSRFRPAKKEQGVVVQKAKYSLSSFGEKSEIKQARRSANQKIFKLARFIK